MKILILILSVFITQVSFSQSGILHPQKDTATVFLTFYDPCWPKTSLIIGFEINCPIYKIRELGITQYEFDELVKNWKPTPINKNTRIIEVRINGKEHTFKELRSILFDRKS